MTEPDNSTFEGMTRMNRRGFLAALMVAPVAASVPWIAKAATAAVETDWASSGTYWAMVHPATLGKVLEDVPDWKPVKGAVDTVEGMRFLEGPIRLSLK